MRDAHDTPALDALFEDVARLRRAAELLDELWSTLGPGFHLRGVAHVTPLEAQEIDGIWGRVQGHFGFDDSE